jgi:hypothetical protein
MMLYDQFQTIFVTVEEDEIRRLIAPDASHEEA